MENLTQKIKEYFESEEGKREVEKFFKHKEFTDSLRNHYLSWFDSIGPERRAHYINKIINKYKSDSYIKRWMDRGCFPQESLYWDIYDYAYKYGKCWNAIAEEVGPGFDSKFVFDDWKVLLYNGQGSIIKILPLTEEDRKRGPDELAQRFLGHEYDYEDMYFATLDDEFA